MSKLIELAQQMVSMLMESGTPKKDAIKQIAVETGLNDKEKDQLERSLDDEPQEPILIPTNRILFDGDDVEAATGILMYKSIPWASKDQDQITFDNVEDLDRAKSVLARRWDFVDSDPQIVASIEFDNLDDYEQVLDFIKSKKLLVDVMGTNTLPVEETEKNIEFRAVKKSLEPNFENANKLRLRKRWK